MRSVFSIVGIKSAFTSKLPSKGYKNRHDEWLMGDKESYVQYPDGWFFIVPFEDENTQDCLSP